MKQDHEITETLDHLARDVATRATIAVGLAGIGVIHLLDSIGKYSETRYLFWMYIALIVGSIGAAGAVLFSRSRGVFLAAAALAGSAALGYVLSRTTGLPNANGDIGNWTEPLGLASLFVEGGVVAVAGGAYLATRRAPAAVRSPRRPIAARSIQAS
jgi:cytochrome bd-type quinol oxidase subunit 2